MLFWIIRLQCHINSSRNTLQLSLMHILLSFFNNIHDLLLVLSLEDFEFVRGFRYTRRWHLDIGAFLKKLTHGSFETLKSLYHFQNSTAPQRSLTRISLLNYGALVENRWFRVYRQQTCTVRHKNGKSYFYLILR